MDYVAIVADDLTGASDTGVKLSKRGYETNVIFNPKDINLLMEKGKILSINASTREKTPEESYSTVFEIIETLKDNKYRKIYKKIDSVLRGNVAIEIEAVMDALNINVAFLLPAIPSNGRYIKDGNLYLDKDLESKLDIKLLLQNTSKCSINTIKIEDIRKGDKSLLDKLYKIVNNDRTIILFDTERNEDFQIIAKVLKNYKNEFILSGASGIVTFLPEIWNLNKENIFPSKIQKTKNHLIIAGTYHNSTEEQIKRLMEEYKCKLIIIDTQRLANIESQSNYLNQLIIKAYDDNEIPEIIIIAVDTLLNPDIIPTKENSELITDFISRISLEVFKWGFIKSLTITGGETAYQVMQTLGAFGMSLKDEIISGLPIGIVLGGIANNMPLVTKSGGFGDSDALVEVIKYLNKDREVVNANANAI